MKNKAETHLICIQCNIIVALRWMFTNAQFNLKNVDMAALSIEVWNFFK